MQHARTYIKKKCKGDILKFHICIIIKIAEWLHIHYLYFSITITPPRRLILPLTILHKISFKVFNLSSMTNQFIIFEWSVMAINHFARKNFITFLTLFQGYKISSGKIIRSGLSEGHHISSAIPAFTWHSISLPRFPFRFINPSRSLSVVLLLFYQTNREGEGRRGSCRMNQRGTAELSVLHWSSSHKDCRDHLWLPLSPSSFSRHDSEFYSLFLSCMPRCRATPRCILSICSISNAVSSTQPVYLIVQF